MKKKIIDFFKLPKGEKKKYSKRMINEKSLLRSIITITFIVSIIIQGIYELNINSSENIVIKLGITTILIILPAYFLVDEINFLIYRKNIIYGQEKTDEYKRKQKTMELVQRIADYVLIYSFCILILSFLIFGIFIIKEYILNKYTIGG